LQGAGIVCIGTVGYSAGSKCVGGRGSVVTGWERIGRGGESRGGEWMRRGRKNSWEGLQCIVAKEKEGK
jgi:hypothetical protein